MQFLIITLFAVICFVKSQLMGVGDPCHEDLIPNPADDTCTTFLRCDHGKVLAIANCPPGLVFNPHIKVCDWPYNYKCPNSPTSASSSSTTTASTSTASSSTASTTTASGSTASVSTASTTKASTTTASTTKASTTSSGSISVGSSCNTNDYTPMPGDTLCQQYYRCINGKVTYIGNCAPLVFNPYVNNCDYPEKYDCNGGNPTTRTTTTTTTTTDGVLVDIPGALITKAQFDAALAGCGYPPGNNNQYMNLVKNAGPAGGITTKTQLAMFFAQILWESDGLRAKSEYMCAWDNCEGSYQSTGLGVPGQYYYGRGYIQLTWDYNYNAASKALFNDNRLILDANQVATNDEIAWQVSFWYWKYNVAVASGYSKNQFGTTTRAINGALECSGGDPYKAKGRYNLYKIVLPAFGSSDAPVETGCYN